MVVIRDEQHLALPPPAYEPYNTFLTVRLHYGGQFCTSPVAEYVGGHVMKLDYVEVKDLCKLNVDAWVNNIKGLSPYRRYYMKSTSGGFKLLIHQRDYEFYSSQYALFKKEMPLYVDADYVCTDYGGSNTIVDVMEVQTETEANHYFWMNEETNVGDMEDVMGEDNDNTLIDSDYEMLDDFYEEEAPTRETREEPEHGDGSDSDEESGNDDEIDVVVTDNELDEAALSDEDVRQSKRPVFNPVEIYDPTFYLGMEFSTKDEFRKAVQSHAIKTKRTLPCLKNDSRRVYYNCAEKGCPWRINAVRLGTTTTFVVRLYKGRHRCSPTYYVKNLKSKWLSERYIQRFKSDATRKVEGFRKDVVHELRVNVSRDQAYRAKRLAVKTLQGSPDIQYTKLWDYADELRKTNAGSTIIIGTDEKEGKTLFSKFYACFGALKQGFENGCRPVICVDGCHLKGPYSGILLTAVSVDPNNCTYPLAYAVVSKENGETWTWFLTVLKQDLKIVNTHGYVLMSDKQKGLLQALLMVFPEAEHRFCVRHLHLNFMSAGYRGLAFKNALWKAARASTVGEFKMRMQEMKDLDASAAEWFRDKHPSQWSKSHFKEVSKCDMLLNNGCETFNMCILEARDQPILTMLEWIREYLMKRLQKNRDEARKKWKGKELCPNIRAILEKNAEKVADCLPLKADDTHYQISGFDGSMYSVNLAEMTCTCRKWALSGIPCKHAISAILHKKEDPVAYVHPCYSVQTYEAVYLPSIKPISGQDCWGESLFIPPLPPNFGRQAGRPSTKRRKGVDEPAGKGKKGKKPTKMRRLQTTVKCRICGQPKHNAATCPLKEGPQKKPRGTSKNKSVSKTSRNFPKSSSAANNEKQTTPTMMPPSTSQADSQVAYCEDVVFGDHTFSYEVQQPNIPGPSMYQQLHLDENHTTGPVIHSSLKNIAPPRAGCRFVRPKKKLPVRRNMVPESVEITNLTQPSQFSNN